MSHSSLVDQVKLFRHRTLSNIEKDTNTLLLRVLILIRKMKELLKILLGPLCNGINSTSITKHRSQNLTRNPNDLSVPSVFTLFNELHDFLNTLQLYKGSDEGFVLGSEIIGDSSNFTRIKLKRLRILLYSFSAFAFVVLLDGFLDGLDFFTSMFSLFFEVSTYKSSCL
jgi:hypothetical protein